MNKITRLYIIMVLSVMCAPTAIFANDSSSSMVETNSSSHLYNNDPDSHEKQHQSDDSHPEMIGDRSWESTSSRMNRQAGATSILAPIPIGEETSKREMVRGSQLPVV